MGPNSSNGDACREMDGSDLTSGGAHKTHLHRKWREVGGWESPSPYVRVKCPYGRLRVVPGLSPRGSCTLPHSCPSFHRQPYLSSVPNSCLESNPIAKR
ncbi:hypothetical protein CRG98_028500 [Punica granatum]|uniref:Uncharacterized protein n=1 Tax=Punica granatum TaxID=22663 RepID=A0A2I0J5C9_PUNGR|nr:hypothetical protein CRG98_028500 [Punica granatum]